MGRRSLKVDIGPTIEKCHVPCYIDVHELYPINERGVNFNIDDCENGIIFNTETHKGEATAFYVTRRIESLINDLAIGSSRPGFAAFISGLSSAVSYLSKQTGSRVKDINRKFSYTYDPNGDVFERLAHNYLRFIYTRYPSAFPIVDIHADPEERTTNVHCIVDRPKAVGMNDPRFEDKLWQWARQIPLTTVFDIKMPDYEKRGLHRSLVAAALPQRMGCTIETGAGESVDEVDALYSVNALIVALNKWGIVNDTDAFTQIDKNLEMLYEMRQPLFPLIINNWFGTRRVRRELFEFKVGYKGAFMPLRETNQYIKKNEVIGAWEHVGFTPILYPTNCALLGLPQTGILYKGEKIVFNLAVVDE